MTESALPNYVAKIVSRDGTPVGTCFQLLPGLLATAGHVVLDVGAQVGDEVSVQSFSSSDCMHARVLAHNDLQDLALLTANGELESSAPSLSMSASNRLGSPVVVGGLTRSPGDDLEFIQLSATGTWQGSAQHENGQHLARIECAGISKGMSGCPVRTSNGAVVALLSARYNSGDGWLRDTAWVATSESLLDLLDSTIERSRIAEIRVVKPQTRAQKAAEIAARRADLAAQLRDLFSLQGYKVLEPLQAWAQTLDLLIEIPIVGTHRLHGVKLILRSGPARAADFTSAYQELELPISERKLDEVMFVADPVPRIDVEGWERVHLGARIQSFSNLMRSSLDLSAYTASCTKLFERAQDGLSNYYVRPRTSSGADLETEVAKWIDNDPAGELPNQKPLAILGSYGLGKSTFALHLTTTLAQEKQNNSSARTPILVPLGDLATQQDLEGLIGKLFTATYNVPGFSFQLFMEMNRRGDFVVILDGFDEMKHLLSWAEFIFTLNELNRLVDGDSKVILLGRPTAFENDDELNEALHGKIGGPLDLPAPIGSVDFHEYEMASLGPDQVRKFLEGYAKYAESVGGSFNFEDVHKQLADSDRLKDIARRPVQLKMLAEILPHYPGQVEELDLVTLYDVFVEQLITQVLDREVKDKVNRQAFDRRERREFLARLAYWMWEQPTARIVTTDHIPESLLEPFLKGRDLKQVRRDLVTASPLDRRGGERIRFSHRSFQEFLVAEETWRRLDSGALAIEEFDSRATDEVAGFVRILRRPKHADLVGRLLEPLAGSISWRTVYSVFLEEVNLMRLLERLNSTVRNPGMGRRMGPWEILAPHVVAIDKGASAGVDYRVYRSLAAADSENVGQALVCAFLFCSLPIPDSVTDEERNTLFNEVVRSVLCTESDREQVDEVSFRQKRRRRRPANTEDSVVVRKGRRPGGDRRSASEYQFADGRAPFIPLTSTYIGDIRGSLQAVGRYLTSAHIETNDNRGFRESLGIVGGTRCEIAWVSGPAIRLAHVLRDLTRLDTRRLGNYFGTELRDVAMVSNWLDGDTIGSGVIKPTNFSLSEETQGLISRMCEATDLFAERWKRRFPSLLWRRPGAYSIPSGS